MTSSVLYIDDEPLLCTAFERILAAHEIRAVAFTDPELALTFAGSHDICAVVCDYRMPSLSGLDVLAQLDRDLPFFLVSGDIETAHRVRDNSRITGVLAKPFTPEMLIASLEPYTSRAKLSRVSKP